jgi:hypothetical protein
MLGSTFSRPQQLTNGIYSQLKLYKQFLKIFCVRNSGLYEKPIKNENEIIYWVS